MSTTDSQKLFREPIAIIGSACRFPGNVHSPSQLWKLLLEPIDLRRQVPAERFAGNTFYHPDPSFHGHCNVSSVYPLTEDIRHFDASFFGVKPVEAASIDPQQRLLMEVVYEGLESAGLTIGKLAGSDTGLYVGMMCDDYQTMLSHDHQETPTYMATGIARTMAANRISHFFDWHGPSMILDTACSSSLVAVHLAVQALRAGDCAVALAAGTSLLLGPEFFISESKLNMLSPQGQSRMWDKAADGYARGEGVATVVLKPLRAALADGDHIECVIRDIDINQDGRTPGLTMPSSAAQTALIKEVYRKAGLDASLPQDRCQYFEAHGTGTPAGDPVEAKAIFDAFFGAHGIVATTNEDRPLLVGSIKTILGHTEGTAGLAGMLKASLALQHELIPQNMQLDELNPAIVPFSTHLKVPTRNMLWPEVPSGQPRRASVNSFGFGGTNCHAILESAPLACMGSESRVSFAPFCFSAQSRHSLLRNLAIHATFLEEHPDINPADLAWTLRSRRSALPYRLCFAASSIVDLRANIGNFLLLATLDQDAVIRSVTPVLATIPRKSTRIFGVFTGQGAQYARMGAELIEQSAYCAEVIDSLDNILSSLPAEDRPTWTLRDELLQDANPARIHEAGLSQPLCTAIQIILVKLLQLAGIKLTAVVGHSSGEIGAAFAAGIISTRDAIRIAYYRGRYASLAMGPTGKSGAMLTVGTSWEDAQDLCSWDEFAGKIVVAASNSPSSVTLAGDEDALAHIDLILDDEKKFRRWLKVDKAYHSPHMRPCSSPYLCALQRCSIQPSFSEPKCVWVSSVDPDSKAAAPPGVEGPYWNENMLHPVRFMHAIESTLSRVGSFDLAIEIGPHPALMGPVMDTVQKHLPNGLPYTGTLYRGKSALTSLKDALLFLHSNMEDGELDWDTLDTYLGGTTTFTTVPDLPTYQWNHDRKYWHNSPYLRRLLHKRHTVHPILGDISPESSPHQLRWRNVLRPSEIPWICHHRLQSQAVFPAAGYIVAALDAAMILAHDRKRPVQLVEIKNMAIHQALAFSSDHDPGVEVVFSVDERHQGQHPESITAGFASSSSLHDHETLQPVASAEITFFFGPPELNILPAPEKNQMQMCRVASEQFYKSLEALGYDYTGAFKGLFSLQRRLGYSSGLLAVPKPEQYEINPFLIHPAVLDMSIQALLLAYSHPNDGRLRSLFVPTTIETVRINPFDLQNATLEHHELSVRATLADRQRHPIEILGDVELTDPTGHHLSVQIHGIRAVPFVSPTSANDRQMFARMHWVSATVDAEAVAANTCPDPDDYKLAEILERASCFYLRQVHRQVEEIGGDIDREGLVASYSRFARNVTTLVAQGKYPYGLREWMDDELEDIMAMTAPFSQKIEINTIHLVGGHLPQFIRGEFNMLEHLMADDLLSTYYTNALSFTKGNEWSGDIVKQMTLRYPQLDILEIGAGTGSATRSILGQIKNQFSSYTFTDISSTFFPNAKQIFHAYGDKIVYRVLDAGRDVTDQGFTKHLYDVVVASSVLHATRCLEDTLRNVRSLLKPGGFLVLCEIVGDCPASTGLIFGTLPSWWVGAPEGRQLGPTVPPVKWASLLRQTGFSGIDSMTEHKYPLLYHVNVMVSQAVDDWVDFLRHPLWPSSLPVAQKSLDMDLVIIGGTTVHVGSLVVELQRFLRPFVRTISIFQSLDMVEPGGIPAQATVFSLAELDQPVFHDLTPASFDGLKTLFSNENAILWLTEGREDRNPKASMTAGFARSVLWEAPELHIQFIDLEDSRVVDSSLLATYLLRHHVARTRARTQELGSYLQSLEREIHVDQYLHESILRWEPLDEANDRFNSANRPITYQVSPRASHVVVDRD